jgi:hemerythrin-like domain-containing protein
MHADARASFRLILGAAEPVAAAQEWERLQPLLDLHERIEDQFVYTPLRAEQGPGTPLGDWDVQHEADVTAVKRLIAEVGQLQSGTPAWQMGVAAVFELLSKHVLIEENAIFGRIVQVWPAERLDQVGAEMEQAVAQATKTSRRGSKQEAGARA